MWVEDIYWVCISVMVGGYVVIGMMDRIDLIYYFIILYLNIMYLFFMLRVVCGEKVFSYWRVVILLCIEELVVFFEMLFVNKFDWCKVLVKEKEEIKINIVI